MHIRRGDTVIIIAGKDRGKRGTVEQVLRQESKIVINGLNVMKRHYKPSTKHPAGGITELSYPLSWSNVMVIDPDTDQPSRTGIQQTGEVKTRFFKKNTNKVKSKMKKDV